MVKHNKKRNVGLLYEFLTRYAAARLVEGDVRGVRDSIKLLKRHFSAGTEIHREFRLFRALLGSYVADGAIAQRIIENSRVASRTIDAEKLDREKSLLIRGINHTLNCEGFYDQRIESYKVCATIQLLLNEWRLDVPADIVAVALQESELLEHLMLPKERDVLVEQSAEIDDLVVKLMARRVDARSRDILTPEQLRLMNSYVCSLRSGDDGKLRLELESLRHDALAGLDALSSDADSTMVERLGELRSLLSESVDVIDDRVMTRYLRVAMLRDEIVGGR